MTFLPLAAAIALGLSLALHFSRYLAAVVRDYGGSAAALNRYRSAFVFCLTGVIGTSAFGFLAGPEPAYGYILGFGIGATLGYLFPLLPPCLSNRVVKQVLQMNAGIPERVTNTDHRALLILSAISPPKEIQRTEGWSPKELASRLDDATDDASGDW